MLLIIFICFVFVEPRLKVGRAAEELSKGGRGGGGGRIKEKVGEDFKAV